MHRKKNSKRPGPQRSRLCRPPGENHMRRSTLPATSGIKTIIGKRWDRHGRTEEQHAVLLHRNLYGRNQVTHEKKKSPGRPGGGLLHQPFHGHSLLSGRGVHVYRHPSSRCISTSRRRWPLTVIIILTMVFLSGTLRFVQESRSGNAGRAAAGHDHHHLHGDPPGAGDGRDPLEEVVAGTSSTSAGTWSRRMCASWRPRTCSSARPP